MPVGSCFLSIIPVRLEPSGKSTMVNQLLFGDTFKLLDEHENWIKISTTHDQYEGWVERNQVDLSAGNEINSTTKQNIVVSTTAKLKNIQGQSPTLLQGSTVSILNDEIHAGDNLYTVENGIIDEPMLFDQQNIINTAYTYLGCPYLWGGRSPFGIDCSGLVQIVFKMVNKLLPRDAWQQALHEGEFIDLIAEAKAGDVAFFDNEEGNIIHVGILTGEGRIIHASGQVRVDVIDHQGIYNHQTRKYTHKLRIIKRFNH